jgi:(+)-trans-carveol dehydrogenase
VGRVEGKVAFITGAARGQGRAHAVRLAEEGADIIAVDICEQIDSVPYELATMEELEETAKMIEELDRRVVIQKADVRSEAQMLEAVQAGVGELGRLDIVLANAGIWNRGVFTEMSDQQFRDLIEVMLFGPYYACRAAIPQLVEQDEGGSIVITSSVAGERGFPYQAHYNMAKHGAIGLMRTIANEFGPQSIRANCVLPTSVETKMFDNPAVWGAFMPDVENPKLADFGDLFSSMHALPVPWVDPVDIANAVLWLASDESRYVTGVNLPVDAGFLAKYG